MENTTADNISTVNAMQSLAKLIDGTEHQDFFIGHRDRYSFLMRIADDCRAAGCSGPVLDVGSSPGHVSALFKLSGRDVTSVDLHPDEQFPARGGREPLNLYKSLGIPVHAVDISREALPFEDGRFSLVMFNETLEHLTGSPLGPVQEIARILAPGGRLIMTTPNAASLRNRLSFLFGKNVFTPLEVAINVSPYKCHNREYTMREALELVRRAGLSPVRATTHNVGEPAAGAAHKIARSIYYAATWAFPPGRSLLCVVAEKPHHSTGGRD